MVVVVVAVQVAVVELAGQVVEVAVFVVAMAAQMAVVGVARQGMAITVKVNLNKKLRTRRPRHTYILNEKL